MNKKVVIFIGLILVAALVIIASVLFKGEEPSTSKETATPAPTAAPTATADSLGMQCIVYDENGNKVNLYEHTGKPMVINFWTSWCEPCKEEMPYFEAAYKKYGDNVQFFIINATGDPDETVEKGASVIEKSGYTFPVVYDKDENAAKKFELSSLPTTLFIDKNGNIALETSGALSADELEQNIKFIL